jgi:hypothetical protein
MIDNLQISFHIFRYFETEIKIKAFYIPEVCVHP